MDDRELLDQLRDTLRRVYALLARARATIRRSEELVDRARSRRGGDPSEGRDRQP